MKSKEEVIEYAHTAIREFFQSEAIQSWRTNELRENYDVVAGSYGGKGQWNQEDYEKFSYDEIPIVTINRTEPVIRSVVGFEIQNRTQVDYIPKMLNTEAEGFNDLVENTARWIEHDSNAQFIDSDAFRDMLICGVGAVDHKMDYTEPPHDGTVDSERVFPGFVGWDIAARQKNFADRNYCFRVKIVRQESLSEDIRKKLDEYDSADMMGMFELDDFLEYFDTTLHSTDGLVMLYYFQWREKAPFYRAQNPFHENLDDPALMEYAALADEVFPGVRLEDTQWNLEPDEYREIKEQLFELGYELDAVKLDKWVYHRAEFVGDVLVSLDLNYSQKGFSIQFMTGDFSETEQMPYGLVRAMKSPQRLFNMSVSNLQGFLNTIPKGGVDIEADAVEDLDAFIETYAKAKEVTVYKPGALQAGKVMPKKSPVLPAGLIDMLRLSMDFVPMVAGVTPDFMGMRDRDDQQVSGTLYARRVKQALTTLASFFDAKRQYMVEKGRLYIDLIRVLAENNPGRLIRNVTGESSREYFRLFADGIAAEYDIIVEEMPQTPDEQQDTFIKLLDAAARDPRLYSLAMEFAPFEKELKDKARQMLAPPPPPQPDPVSQQLLQAETQMKMADAENKKAQSELNKAKALSELKALNEGETKEPAKLNELVDMQEKIANRQLKERELDIREDENIRDAMIASERLAIESQKAANI